MTNNMGRVVSVSLGAGVVVAPAIVTVGPVAGAQEHVVTGTILLAFACSWALLAMLSRRIGQPQSWAAMPANWVALAAAVRQSAETARQRWRLLLEASGFFPAASGRLARIST